MASAWGSSWGDSWGDSWGTDSVAIQDAWGDSWGCSWGDSWGHVCVATTTDTHDGVDRIEILVRDDRFIIELASAIVMSGFLNNTRH